MNTLYRSMSAVITIALLLSGARFCSAGQFVQTSPQRICRNLNAGWLYIPQNIANGQLKSLSESSFEKVCLPHTNKIVNHINIDTSCFAFISWYRKHITPDPKYAGRRFILEFQGVSKVATVYINGDSVGEHKGPYTPFSLDITDKLTPGSDNVIAVKVDSRQRKDVPPEGSALDYIVFGGIVRDVSLTIVNPLHVEWVFISTPTAGTAAATVRVQTRIRNNSSSAKSCSVLSTITDSAGTVSAYVQSSHTVLPDSCYDFCDTTPVIPNPRLWHPDHPYLYTVYSQVLCDTGAVDTYTEKLGIRSIVFDKTSGKFFINGEYLKLRGLNRHETYPFIGRAAANRLQRKDAEMLKYDFGCNTIRCSHYPQDPEFLRRCDEVGLLVLEEIPGWKFVNSANTAWTGLLKDALRDMVVRDRNHPCIMSFGVRVNESADYHDLYTATNALARTLDPTRPTHGVRIPGAGAYSEFLEDIWAKNFACTLGTPGVLPWITTETVGHRCATHSWDTTGRLIDQMLQYAAVQDSAAQNSHIAGLLGWCAFDYYSTYYIAEKRMCYHGVADIFRIPKFSAYFFKSQTDPAIYSPMVFIAHYWEKSLVPNNDVWVVSNCDSVELFVSGVSQGKRGPQYYMYLHHPLFKWPAVPYAAGELKAVGYIQGSAVTSFIRHTPGKAIKLVVSPDTAAIFDNGDMTRIVVTAVDSFGQVVPRNSDTVTLSASGAGNFLGESPIALEDGKTAFFVQTRENEQGTIVCQAVSSKLPMATATISVLRSDTATIGIASVTKQKNVAPAHSKTMLVTTSRFEVPGWAVHTCKIAVYTPMGRLLYEKPITSTIISLPHQTVANALQLFIVRIVPEK